jgi:hypothetical protein
VSDTSRLCDCGHSQAVHVGLQRECQATVPTHCQCKAWMHAVENVGTDKRRAESPSGLLATSRGGQKTRRRDP